MKKADKILASEVFVGMEYLDMYDRIKKVTSVEYTKTGRVKIKVDGRDLSNGPIKPTSFLESKTRY